MLRILYLFIMMSDHNERKCFKKVMVELKKRFKGKLQILKLFNKVIRELKNYFKKIKKNKLNRKRCDKELQFYFNIIRRVQKMNKLQDNSGIFRALRIYNTRS